MLSRGVRFLVAVTLVLFADARPFPGVCVWNGQTCEIQYDVLDAKIRPLRHVCDGVNDCDYPFDVRQHAGSLAASRCGAAKSDGECRYQAYKQGTYVDVVVQSALMGMKDRMRTLCHWSDNKCELDRVLLARYFQGHKCVRRRAVAKAMKARCLESQNQDACAPGSKAVYRFADMMASMYACA